MQAVKLESSRFIPSRLPWHFLPPDGREGSTKKSTDPYGRTAGADDLPYVVEVWDDGKKLVEQTLAVTANGSIGYAAYYEATKEFPSRYITLRHKNRVIARWNPPGH